MSGITIGEREIQWTRLPTQRETFELRAMQSTLPTFGADATNQQRFEVAAICVQRVTDALRPYLSDADWQWVVDEVPLIVVHEMLEALLATREVSADAMGKFVLRRLP